MKKVAAIGSCLSALTMSMLVGDHRWVRLNSAAIDRSDLFVRYVLRQSPMPSRDFVERVLAVKPEHAADAKHVFDRMFREGVGLVEMPPGTQSLFHNLQHETIDAFVLDNLNDAAAVICTYLSFDGKLDFDFNFPLHWCEKAAWMQDGLRWGPAMAPADSAAHWAEIVRFLKAAQPAARIVFICAPSSTFADNADRRARADAFEPLFRTAIGNAEVDIVPQMHIPRELSKLPDDTEHFALSVYRALAGRVLTSVLAKTPVAAHG